jgi:hypothetical protein
MAPKGSLVGTYLVEAAEFLRRSSGPETFDPKAATVARQLESTPHDSETVALRRSLEAFQVMAAIERVGLSRTSMLHSAFAAEAAANEFIANKCSSSDRDAIDRLSTPDKFSIAPRLALGRDLFPRDTEPMTSIREMFVRRNELVHPKPGVGHPKSPYALAADPTFSPKVAARFLLATSRAAYDLGAHYDDDSDGSLMSMALNGAANSIRAYADSATTELPSPTASPLPNFWEIYMKRVKENDRSRATAAASDDLAEN